MTDRQLKPSESASPIPSLAEVRQGGAGRRVGAVVAAMGVTGLAAGAVYAGDPPQCGSSRVDELRAHSDSIATSARRADAAQVIREIGVALGFVHHTSTGCGSEPGVHAAGEMMNVSTNPVEPGQLVNTPTQPQPPQPPTAGAPMPVTPHPPPPPQNPPLPRTPVPQPPGGMPVVRPNPPTPPQPPAGQVRPHPQPRGGARRVDPTPDGRLGDISQVTVLPREVIEG